MDKPAPDALDAECRILCDYLVSREPDPYVLEKYRRAHALGHPLGGGSAGRVDRWLLRFARSGRIGVAAADAYAAAFARTSLLRRKLVLLLAILECTSTAAETLDVADRGSRIGFFLAAAGKGFAFAVLAAGVAVVIQVLRVARIRDGKSPEGS